MSATNKIYTGQLGLSIVGVGAISGTFQLLSVGRSMKIKSITVDFNVFDNISSRIIPFERLTEAQLLINVGSILSSEGNIASPVNYPAAVCFDTTGKGFNITRPCQLIFNSFYVENRLPITYQITNYIGNKTFMLSFLIETEEKTIFG